MTTGFNDYYSQATGIDYSNYSDIELANRLRVKLYEFCLEYGIAEGFALFSNIWVRVGIFCNTDRVSISDCKLLPILIINDADGNYNLRPDCYCTCYVMNGTVSCNGGMQVFVMGENCEVRCCDCDVIVRTGASVRVEGGNLFALGHSAVYCNYGCKIVAKENAAVYASASCILRAVYNEAVVSFKHVWD